MPDEHYDPFDTGSQKSESQPNDADHSTLPEADAPGTYGLGNPIELPELRPPPRPVIERLEAEQAEASAGTSSKSAVRRERIGEEDPLVGNSVVSAIWYPLSGNGFRVLGLYTVLFWMVPNVPIPGVREILLLATYGYVGMLYLESAKFALERIPLGPRLPDLNLEDIQIGLLALVVVFISGVPFFLSHTPIVSALFSTSMRLVLMIAGVFFSLFYIPMGFLALAELENESALNPLVVFRGIGKMIGPYFVLFSLAAVSFVIPLLAMMNSDIHWVLADLIRSFLLIYITIALLRAVAIVFRDRGIDFEQSE